MKNKAELSIIIGGTALGIAGVILAMCVPPSAILYTIGLFTAALTMPAWTSAIGLGILTLTSKIKKNELNSNSSDNKEHFVVEYRSLTKDNNAQNEYEQNVMKSAKETLTKHVPNTTPEQIAKNIVDNNTMQR